MYPHVGNFFRSKNTQNTIKIQFWVVPPLVAMWETTPNFIFGGRSTPNCIKCACFEATRIENRANPDMLGSSFNQQINKQLPKCNFGWFLPLIRRRNHPKFHVHTKKNLKLHYACMLGSYTHRKSYQTPHVSTCWEACSIGKYIKHYQTAMLGVSYPCFHR
jgi:hypothetical protein